jgi:hypothetical protein
MCPPPCLASSHLFVAAPVHEKLLSLFSKAGYEVVYPEGLSSSCCGMMFNSRGFKDAAAKKGAELEASLLKASEGGKWPIVCDTSPCLSQIKAGLSDPALRSVGDGWRLGNLLLYHVACCCSGVLPYHVVQRRCCHATLIMALLHSYYR